MRLASAVLLATTFLWAVAPIKLYLKDGGYHVVREYQIQGDRVRYLSSERGEWEEVPVTLVDLPKTEHERAAQAERSQAEERAQDEEDQAERAQKQEIAAIPMGPGGYYKRADGKVDALPSADYQVLTDKKRRALQMVSPIPLIAGKATVVIKGDRSKFEVAESRPSFYFRLVKEERFGIVRLTPKKDTRIVENISILPVAQQAFEERKQMETFEQELAEGLFRIWPEKPLTAGEYALVEFSNKEDMTDIELMVWDFACRPESK